MGSATNLIDTSRETSLTPLLTVSRLRLFVPWSVFVLYCLSIVASYLMILGVFPYMRVAFAYLALMPLMVALQWWWRDRVEDGWDRTNSLLGWTLLAWMAIVHAAWYPAIQTTTWADEYYSTAASTLIIPLLLWPVGLMMGRTFSRAECSIYVKGVIWITLAAFAIVVFYGVIRSQSEFGMTSLYLQNYAMRIHINNQVIADLTACVGLLLMGFYRSAPIRQSLVAVCTVGVLFFAHSRSSLALFLLIAAVWCCVTIFRHSRRAPLLLALVPVALGAIAVPVALRSSQWSQWKAVERMETIISNPTEDPSYQARLEILQEAAPEISRHWLIGQYMNEWWRSEEAGGYIHNWLSFLVAFGIGPFLLFFLLTFRLMRKCFSRRIVSDGAAAIPLLLFMFASIVLSRSYCTPWVWFAIGFAVGLPYAKAGLSRLGARQQRLPISRVTASS